VDQNHPIGESTNTGLPMIFAQACQFNNKKLSSYRTTGKNAIDGTPENGDWVAELQKNGERIIQGNVQRTRCHSRRLKFQRCVRKKKLETDHTAEKKKTLNS